MQNKTKVETAIIFSLFVFSILIASAIFVFAQEVNQTSNTTAKRGLVVSPAKLGIYRVTIPLFSDYVENKSFMVGNAYDFPINITLKWNGNISEVTELSVTSFTLQPNETRQVYYTLTVKEPGLYSGGAAIIASATGKTTFIGYQADIYVFAWKSKVPETTLYAVGGVAVLAVAFLGYKKFGKGKSESKEKKKEKKFRFLTAAILLFVVSVSFFVFVANASSVNAADVKNVAMIVKNAASLDNTHEKRIYDILLDMGHDVTLVDKNIGVNYYSYDLIVIAGRPLGSSTLDSFVANIPVNDIPTIAIDYAYLDEWGWVKAPGISSLSSSDRQKVYPQIVHPLTNGYAVGQKVYVHLIQGYTVIDLIKSKTTLRIVATADIGGDLPIIAYANPNTQLASGKKVGNNAAIVFFGVTYPNLWTEDAVKLFKNSVNWLLSLDFTQPTVPQFKNGESFFDKDGTVVWEWNASQHPSGISYYEFQLSSSPTFATIITNTTTTALNFTTSGLADMQTYYARVRAYNTLNIYSNWSTSRVTIDSTDLIIKINSPASGTTISSGSSVLINATIATPNRMPATNGTCSISIANVNVGTIQFNKTINTCSGNVTAPSLSFVGSANLIVSATNTLNHTNSTSLPIYYQGSVPQPESSSSSSSSGGGSSGGSSPGALLFAQVPTQLSGHENSDLSFVVNVKNEGLIEVEAVKVLIDDADFASSAEVTPVLIDSLAPAASQEFSVTLHFPENSAGNYQFKVKVIAYGASITRRVNVEVLKEVLEPKLKVAGSELPSSFIEGQETTVNITLANDGNVAANAEVNVVLPTGWEMRKEDGNQFVEIQEGSNEKVLFHVTPSSQSGKIEFDVSYSVGSEQKSFAQSYDASVSTEASSMTGLVGFVSKPEFFVPALIGIGAFVIVYFGISGGMKGLKMPKTRITNSTLSPVSKSVSKSLGNFVKSLYPSQESLKYVWPKGSKGLIFNSLFGASAGLATGSATSHAAARIPRAQKGSGSVATRVLPKTSMYEKWENQYHHPRGHGKG